MTSNYVYKTTGAGLASSASEASAQRSSRGQRSDTLRKVLITLAVLVTIGLTVASGVGYAAGWLDKETWESLGYLGIFITNFAPHATLFFPIPGLAATGHASILFGAEALTLC